MNVQTENILTSRQEWWKIVSAFSRAEKEPKYRRQSRRYVCSGEIKVTGEVDDEPFKQTWTLLQVSADGITARSNREIPSGLPIKIQWRRDEETLALFGRIMHCTQTIGGFKVGIKLEFADD